MAHLENNLTDVCRSRVFWFALALIIIPITLWAQSKDDAGKAASDAQPADAAVGGNADGPASSGPDPVAPADEQADEEAQPANDQTNAEASDTSEGADENAKSIWRSGLLGLMRDGGVFMWFLALMGILATGVIIERFRSLHMVNTDSSQVVEQVRTLLQDDRVEEALQLCEHQQGPVPAVLSAGLRKYYVLRRLNYDPATIEPQVVKAMDDYSVHISAALEKNLAILATVSSAAPMLGFLGTVQGMIVAFKDIVAKMGETNIVEAAAQGIQVSLLTTCFGLIIGIPAYVAFNYFTSVTNRYVLDVEESATELVESVTLQMALSKSPATAKPVA